MAAAQKRPPGNRRRKVAPKDDKTKFDKWLERMRDDRASIDFNFAIPPLEGVAGMAHSCHVIDVDRYMLLLEFSDLADEDDGMVWWVSKSIITAAAPAAVAGVR
jgi:hypothetical protein